MNDWDTPIRNLAEIPPGMPEAPPMTQDAGALLKLAERIGNTYFKGAGPFTYSIGELSLDDLNLICASLRQAASQGRAGGEAVADLRQELENARRHIINNNGLDADRCIGRAIAALSPPVKTGGEDRSAVQSEEAGKWPEIDRELSAYVQTIRADLIEQCAKIAESEPATHAERCIAAPYAVRSNAADRIRALANSREPASIAQTSAVQSELADRISDANLPAIDIYKTMIRVDPGYYVLMPSDVRDKVEHALCGVAQASRDSAAIECLRSIAEASDQEPREPDDADWRFRFLEAQRAARCTLSALPLAHRSRPIPETEEEAEEAKLK